MYIWLGRGGQLRYGPTQPEPGKAISAEVDGVTGLYDAPPDDPDTV